MQHTNLQGADLTGANLEGVHLTGGDLRGCKLDWQSLDLRFASVREAAVTADEYDAIDLPEDKKVSLKLLISDPSDVDGATWSMLSQHTAHPCCVFLLGPRTNPSDRWNTSALQILESAGAEVHCVNVLEEREQFTSSLRRFSRWPSFPMVFIGGRLVGGCFALVQLADNGRLTGLLQSANALRQQDNEATE